LPLGRSAAIIPAHHDARIAMAKAHLPRLITTPAGLQELIEHLRAEGRFAFDTEFVSEETFEPVLGLIQVATREQLALIDPLTLRDLSAFWDLVNDPAIEVVMHAAGEDLRICRYHSGKVPARVYDVQIAAGFTGLGYPLSLGNLVSQTVGKTVHGGETRTDWRRRPLTEAQLHYALDDVRYLLDIAGLVSTKLSALGRTAWVESELLQFAAAIQARSEEDRWRRLPGLHQLNRRSLEIARRLADWRQTEARRANRPLRQVLRDDLIIAIAKRQPARRQDLEALRDFNRPHLLAKSSEILAAVAAAQAVPPEDLPEPAERHEERPGLTMLVNLLSAVLARCCAEQGIAGGLVGTTSDLKDLVRWHSQGRPPTRPPALAVDWRHEVCGQTLLDVLEGRVTLRIANHDSDVPIDLERSEIERKSK
jgi:ribonuclease D